MQQSTHNVDHEQSSGEMVQTVFRTRVHFFHSVCGRNRLGLADIVFAEEKLPVEIAYLNAVVVCHPESRPQRLLMDVSIVHCHFYLHG